MASLNDEINVREFSKQIDKTDKAIKEMKTSKKKKPFTSLRKKKLRKK